jgi:HEAT repeat protein
MKEEITKALTSLVRAGGKADVAVIAALSDALAVRRIAAAEALAAAGDARHFAAVRKLLKDAESAVRLRVALALVTGQDRASVPPLIAMLGEMPRGDVWEIEELLHRLAGDKAPVVAWGKDSAEERTKLQGAWRAYERICRLGFDAGGGGQPQGWR